MTPYGFAPGEKHLHGASPEVATTHVTIAKTLDGKAADSLEHLTYAEYGVSSHKGNDNPAPAGAGESVGLGNRAISQPRTNGDQPATCRRDQGRLARSLHS